VLVSLPSNHNSKSAVTPPNSAGTGVVESTTKSPPLSANEAPPTSRQKLSDALDKNIASVKKEKQEFEQYLREQFHDLEDKVQALREKGTELHESTKSNLNEKLENLKEQKKAILSKIENLRNTSENAWKDIRENILNSMHDLEQSLSQSSQSH